MTVTSTPKNACNANILLADEIGAMKDISGQSNQVGLPRNITLADFVVFADANTYRLACKKDWSITLQIIYSMGVDEAKYLLNQWYHSYHTQARRVILSMPDNAIGSDRYDGYGFLESLEMTPDAGEAGPVLVSATILGNGELVLSTISTT